MYSPLNSPSHTTKIFTPTESRYVMYSTTSIKYQLYSPQKTSTQQYQEEKKYNPSAIIPTQVATTTTVAIVATTVVSPIASLQMARSTAITTLIKCNDIDEDASYADYQIQISIGSTRFSILGGSVLIASLGTTLALVHFCYTIQKQKSIKHFTLLLEHLLLYYYHSTHH